jgi:hypothetical protein
VSITTNVVSSNPAKWRGVLDTTLCDEVFPNLCKYEIGRENGTSFLSTLLYKCITHTDDGYVKIQIAFVQPRVIPLLSHAQIKQNVNVGFRLILLHLPYCFTKSFSTTELIFLILKLSKLLYIPNCPEFVLKMVPDL